jgi:hypothetical protein
MEKEKKSQKVDCDFGSPPGGKKVIDLEQLKSIWIPARDQRIMNGEIKIHSLQDERLLGGDFVLNKHGEASTLSFCFEYGGENFGLFVGHLCEKGGDPVFALF